MKIAVNTPSRKTNNQASFCGSRRGLLLNNMEVEAAMELQQYLDEIGVHQVRIVYAVWNLSLHLVQPRFA